MPRKNYPKKSKKPLHSAQKTLDAASTQRIVCHVKQRFPTQNQAKYQAETLELVHHTSLEVYLCNNCQGWHLTRAKTFESQKPKRNFK